MINFVIFLPFDKKKNYTKINKEDLSLTYFCMLV